MTGRSRRLARLGLTAGLIALLAGAGTGAAWGYWTASTSVGTTASAATVGVTQQLASGSSLAVVYSTSTTAGAGAITVTNTSSRSGGYTLALAATSATSTVRAAVAAQIGTAASCTPTAALTNAVTGTLAAPPSASGTLAAGASTTLCLQTSMTASDIAANGGASIGVSVTASIAVGTWSASASPIAVSQSVAASTSVSVGPGWYQIKTSNSSQCVAYGYDDYHAVQAGCQSSAAEQLWRFAATSGGYVHVISKQSGSTWWQAASATAGAVVGFSTSTSTLAEWRIVDAGGGKVQFALRADPTLCLQKPGNNGNKNPLTLQPCSSSVAAQQFALAPYETAVPAPTTLTCGGGGYNLTMSWPELTGYQGDVVYRVSVDGGIDTLHGRAGGYDPTAQWSSSFATTYGIGSHQVLVEQSVFGSTWTTVGTGTVTVTSLGGPYFQCG